MIYKILNGLILILLTICFYFSMTLNFSLPDKLLTALSLSIACANFVVSVLNKS